MPAQMPKKIKDVEVIEVSFVDKAANNKKFAMLKRALDFSKMGSMRADQLRATIMMLAKQLAVACPGCGWKGTSDQLAVGNTCPKCGAEVQSDEMSTDTPAGETPQAASPEPQEALSAAMKVVMDESLAPLMEILTAIMDLVGGPKEETPEVDVEADKVAQPVATKVVEDMEGGSVDSTETGGTEEAVQEDIETLPRITFYRNVETGAVRAVGVDESGAVVASSDDIPEETLLADRAPENYELVNDGDLGEGWEEAGESLAAKGCDEDEEEDDKKKDVGKASNMEEALVMYMSYIDDGMSEDEALEMAALEWEVDEVDLLELIETS